MDVILYAFKQCFGPSEQYHPRDTKTLSKATLMIMIPHYQIKYTITDRKSGKILKDYPLIKYDENRHNIAISQ